MVDRVKELEFLIKIVKCCKDLNEMAVGITNKLDELSNVTIERHTKISQEIKEFEDSIDYTKQMITEEEIEKQYNKQMGAHES